MLTADETAELRAKVVANSDRAKASGKPVGILEHAGGPQDGPTIALTQPAPLIGLYGWRDNRDRADAGVVLPGGAVGRLAVRGVPEPARDYGPAGVNGFTFNRC